MPAAIRVFVNERAVELPAGSDGRTAIVAAAPELAPALAAGTALVLDGRGIEVSPDLPLEAGAILRVVISSRSTAG
jgi:hypothetical protein